MNTIEINAWVAGLFEGEGTFIFSKDTPKGISITSTDLDVLERVKANFGGRIYKHNMSGKPEIWKQSYHWVLGLKFCKDFYNTISPYLFERRKKRGLYFINRLEEMLLCRLDKSVLRQEKINSILKLSSIGLNQTEISKETGINRTYINKVLRGKI